MRQINRILLVAAVIGISASVSPAREPATQPVTPVSEQVAPVNGPGDLLPPPGDAGTSSPASSAAGAASAPDGRNRRAEHTLSPFRQRPLTEKDLSDARLYMQTHSPLRFKAIEALPDGKEKSGIENFTAHAYLNWMRLANDDFQLYAVVEKRVELEDAIYGKAMQLRSGPPQAQDATRAQLKELVGKLVDNGIRERQLRLDRLQQTIKQEQAKLAEDSANRPAVVEQRYDAIVSSEAGGLLHSEPGLGGGAQHGHGGAGRPPK